MTPKYINVPKVILHFLKHLNTNVYVLQLLPMLTQDFTKEGWLSKTGPNKGDSYRKRWFSLLRRTLRYYEQPMVRSIQQIFQSRAHFMKLFARTWFLGCLSEGRDFRGPHRGRVQVEGRSSTGDQRSGPLVHAAHAQPPLPHRGAVDGGEDGLDGNPQAAHRDAADHARPDRASATQSKVTTSSAQHMCTSNSLPHHFPSITLPTHSRSFTSDHVCWHMWIRIQSLHDTFARSSTFEPPKMYFYSTI